MEFVIFHNLFCEKVLEGIRVRTKINGRVLSDALLTMEARGLQHYIFIYLKISNLFSINRGGSGMERV